MQKYSQLPALPDLRPKKRKIKVYVDGQPVLLIQAAQNQATIDVRPIHGTIFEHKKPVRYGSTLSLFERVERSGTLQGSFARTNQNEEAQFSLKEEVPLVWNGRLFQNVEGQATVPTPTLSYERKSETMTIDFSRQQTHTTNLHPHNNALPRCFYGMDELQGSTLTCKSQLMSNWYRNYPLYHELRILVRPIFPSRPSLPTNDIPLACVRIPMRLHENQSAPRAPPTVSHSMAARPRLILERPGQLEAMLSWIRAESALQEKVCVSLEGMEAARRVEISGAEAGSLPLKDFQKHQQDERVQAGPAPEMLKFPQQRATQEPQRSTVLEPQWNYVQMQHDLDAAERALEADFHQRVAVHFRMQGSEAHPFYQFQSETLAGIIATGLEAERKERGDASEEAVDPPLHDAAESRKHVWARFVKYQQELGCPRLEDFAQIAEGYEAFSQLILGVKEPDQLRYLRNRLHALEVATELTIFTETSRQESIAAGQRACMEASIRVQNKYKDKVNALGDPQSADAQKAFEQVNREEAQQRAIQQAEDVEELIKIHGLYAAEDADGAQ